MKFQIPSLWVGRISDRQPGDRLIGARVSAGAPATWGQTRRRLLRHWPGAEVPEGARTGALLACLSRVRVCASLRCLLLAALSLIPRPPKGYPAIKSPRVNVFPGAAGKRKTR